jgi:hypothetical protein
VDAESAVVIAARCGEDVEVLDRRSEWETLVAQPDGLMRLDVSTVAVRTRTSGQWADVDRSVVAGADGLAVASPVVPMTFSDGRPGAPLVRLVKDGHEVVMDTPFDLPVPVVEGGSITYEQVRPGIDLVVSVNDDATGFAQVLRVASPSAAADPLLEGLTFPVTTSDGASLAGIDGGGFVVRAAGEDVFVSPAPVMWDSSGDPGSNSARRVIFGSSPREGDEAVVPAIGDEVVPMVSEILADSVTLVPDEELLTDPDTRWPVFVDPSLSATRTNWTSIRSDSTAEGQFSTTQGLGLCDRNDPYNGGCFRTRAYRLMWQFDGLDTIAGLGDPSLVTSAFFAATGTHSYHCTPEVTEAYQVPLFSGAGSWSGWRAVRHLENRSVTHRTGCAGTVGYTEFNALGVARSLVSERSASVAIGLKASNESTMAGWKRYDKAAVFSVTFNRPPNVPSNRHVTTPATSIGCATGDNRPAVRTRTPTFNATISDPDGGNLRAQFELFAGTRKVWAPGMTAQAVSGSVHAVTVPSSLNLAEGVVYHWVARGYDGSAYGAWARACELVVDVTAPQHLPGVTAVASPGGAVYTPHSPGVEGVGGVGVPGRFRLDPGLNTDVGTYRVSVNGVGGRTISVDDPVVDLVPLDEGLHTLRVRAVDRAGNVADQVTSYVFNVAVGKPTTWLLDEDTGTVANAVDLLGAPVPTARLTVSGATWGAGYLSTLAPSAPAYDARDRALVFSGTGGEAATSGPVLRTDGSFTVMAWVNARSVPTESATAVSQDGKVSSGFSLGIRRHASLCPKGCWSMFMYPTDAVTSVVQATTTTPVRAGEWVMLAGTYHAGNQEMQLHTCPAVAQQLVSGQAVPFTSTWTATGPFRVGRGQGNGVPARRFPGSVGGVRIYQGVITEADLKRTCQSGTFPPPAPSNPRDGE